jgi:Vitamin K-dependent gamma-carboxylase
VKAKVQELLGADLRSLAALRICVGIILLLDLCQRATDLEAHYSDFGLMPRELAIQNLSSRWFWSFHFLSGTWQAQAILFIAAGILAGALLIGYQTRIATVGSWAFLVSLDVRNLHILAGGDLLLRAVLFWSMFLPWGARFSVDNSWSDVGRQLPKRIVSAGTVAFTIQIVILYWFSVLSKSGHEWWRDGSAVYYALSIDYVVTPFGHWLLRLPSATLQFATWSVLGYEIFGPILLFSSWCIGPIRTLVVAGFVTLHLAILSTLLIGIFPLIAIASILFFLPSWFWDDLLPRFAPCDKRALAIKYSAKLVALAPVLGFARIKYIGEQADRPTACNIPTAASYGIRLSAGASAIATVLTAYMIVWNIGNLPYSPIKLSDRARSIGNVLGLDQAWEMFAPFPAKDDGWYVIPARLKNGRQIDLYRNGAMVDWSKPKYISLTIKNHRWRKFFELLRQRKFLPLSYADYLCRDWNRRHSSAESIQEIEIIFMVEWTRPNFEYFEPRELMILNHQCPTATARPSPG